MIIRRTDTGSNNSFICSRTNLVSLNLRNFIYGILRYFAFLLLRSILKRLKEN